MAPFLRISPYAHKVILYLNSKITDFQRVIYFIRAEYAEITGFIFLYANRFTTNIYCKFTNSQMKAADKSLCKIFVNFARFSCANFTELPCF